MRQSCSEGPGHQRPGRILHRLGHLAACWWLPGAASRVPLLTASPLLNSLTYQIRDRRRGRLGVYIMLRMGLLSFTVPAFMAIGGYAAAMLAKAGTTEPAAC